MTTLPYFIADGICAQTDPEEFFPAKGDSDTVKRAKAVCAECPVKAECLEAALENREQYGVWGGLNVTERQRLLADQRTERKAS